MRALLQHLVLMAVAAWMTWVLFLRRPETPPSVWAPPPELPVAVMPEVRASRSPEEEPAAPPQPQASQGENPEQASAAAEAAPPSPPTPPPPELGTPEGQEEGTAAAEGKPPVGEAEEAHREQAAASAEETSADPSGALDHEASDSAGEARSSAEELMTDPTLLEAARQELTGQARKGFTTVLLSAPEDQLAIARHFGEELVLVPRSALDPRNASPRYFRIALEGPEAVEIVPGRPPLERFRQYRDLFDYEYARLPAPLRELRRSVLARSEVYLFAALIPPAEWALVIGRREAALSRAGRPAAGVRRFQLRYLPLPDGGFDLQVTEILFDDGTRYQADSR